MKKNLFLLLGFFVSTSCTLFSANLDNCKNFGDPCVCSNTKFSGYCLPGWKSENPDQLYCACSDDVLSEEEVIKIMIDKYCNPSNTRLRNVVDTSTSSQKTSKVLKEIYNLIETNKKNAANAQKSKLPGGLRLTADMEKAVQRSLKAAADTQQKNMEARIKTLHPELMRAMRMEKSLKYFFTVFDDCDYVNKECICGNTGRRGVCGVSRKAHEAGTDEIKCLCE